MKKNFLTGLALLLPAILTLLIVIFFINLLTNPFINMVESAVGQGGAFDSSPVLKLMIRLIILLLIFLFIILIGFLTQTLFVYSLINMTDKFIHRIPVVNKIYKSLQEVIQTLFSTNGSTFKQVVLVPYPHEDSLSIGFITTDITSASNEPKLKDKVSVFVPGTPNPTFGFILMYPKDQVILTSMKVEEAFKLLVSCGIMLPIPPPKI